MGGGGADGGSDKSAKHLMGGGGADGGSEIWKREAPYGGGGTFCYALTHSVALDLRQLT